MSTNQKILWMGIILSISGIVAAVISVAPSTILQYIFIGASLTVGALGLLTNKKEDSSVIRPAYYSWIGLVFIGLSIALIIWGTSATALVNVLGFSLLLLGITAFALALQILINQKPIPWNVVGLTLSLSATSAIGAASILSLAGLDIYTGLLFLGVLFVTVGLSIVQLSRLKKDHDSAMIN